MSTESRGTEKPPAGKSAAKWWCNFCGFKTNDRAEYLAHSCAEVLKQQGKTAAAGGKNACG